MIIKTTAEQDEMILRWYKAIVRAHYEEECEPPGYTLEIELGLPSHFEIEGQAVCGPRHLRLGVVEVTSLDYRQS